MAMEHAPMPRPDPAPRRVIRLLALVALLAGVLPAPARADCFDWAAPGVVVEDGTLRGLPPGPVRWRIGRMPAGGSHLQTAVELRWTGPDRGEQRQTLFSEIQDGRAYLTARAGRLDLRVTYCAQGQPCRETALPFAWDRAAGRFSAGSPAARASLSAACVVADEPATRPAR
jgi:hypothetical protein